MPSVRLSKAKVIGSVRDCGSSTLPKLTRRPAGKRSGSPGDLDLGRARESGARRLRFRNLPDDVDLRRIDHAEQDRSRGNVGTRRGIALGDHAAHRRPNDERSLCVGRAAGARGVVLRQAGLGGSKTRLGLLLGRTSLVEPLRRRRTCARQALCAFPVAGRQRERGLRFRARPLKLRKVAGRGRRRQQPRELLPTRDTSRQAARPRRASADRQWAQPRRRRRLASPRGAPEREWIHGPPALARAAVPKSRLHCCSFRKLMPGASSPPGGAAARAGFSIRVHIDVANPVFIVQSRGLEHDYELALARLRGFHVDPEDALGEKARPRETLLAAPSRLRGEPPHCLQ